MLKKKSTFFAALICVFAVLFTATGYAAWSSDIVTVNGSVKAQSNFNVYFYSAVREDYLGLLESSITRTDSNHTLVISAKFDYKGAGMTVRVRVQNNGTIAAKPSATPYTLTRVSGNSSSLYFDASITPDGGTWNTLAPGAYQMFTVRIDCNNVYATDRTGVLKIQLHYESDINTFNGQPSFSIT